MGVLSGLKPERVMYYFEEITKIPRCSHDEQRISDYLVSVGKDLGLEVIQDDFLNVIIKKTATKGYEHKDIIVLQGHMDMVCEKTQESNHDFSKDPIKIQVEDDFIIAKETTLGADNGIALAMILALLETKDAIHPPLEALFTSDEEAGMSGAENLDPNNIKGKILINLDSEEEGKVLVSCAGGERNILTIPVQWKENNKDVYEIIVSGLDGGHSGADIEKGKGNSNKILGRVLDRISRKIDFDLSFIEGGSKSNAIPRYSKAVIAIEKDHIDKLKEIVSTVEKELKSEFIHSDKNITLNVNPTFGYNKIVSEENQKSVIAALMLMPNGVQSMSMAIEGLVESSNNLGVVKTLEDKITMESAIRSSVGSLKTNISNQIDLLANSIGAISESSSSYPAWEYKEDSKIREIFIKAYKEYAGKDLQVEAIHAGLECGLFDEKFHNMDMISFGPDMEGVHAPGEKLSISSTERSYEFLLKVMENFCIS